MNHHRYQIQDSFPYGLVVCEETVGSDVAVKVVPSKASRQTPYGIAGLEHLYVEITFAQQQRTAKTGNPCSEDGYPLHQEWSLQ
jgi:hypothetical protein